MTTPTYITTSGGRISAFLIDNLREPGARPAAAPLLQAHGRYQDLLANPAEKSGMVA